MENPATLLTRQYVRVRCHNCFNYVTAKQEPDGSLSVKCSYCHTLMIIRKRNKTSLIKLIREN